MNTTRKSKSIKTKPALLSKAKSKKADVSKIELAILDQFWIGEWVPEYKFHPTRKWRFDYALPAYKIAIEVEGGVWIRGRHNHPAGFVKDIEKYNEANALGWNIIRVLPGDLYKSPDRILDLIKRTKEHKQAFHMKH